MSKKEKKKKKRRERRYRNRISRQKTQEDVFTEDMSKFWIERLIREFHNHINKITENEGRLTIFKLQIDSIKFWQLWKINNKRKLKRAIPELERTIAQDTTELYSVYFEPARVLSRSW